MRGALVQIQDVFPNGTAMLIQKGAVRMRWRGPNANGDKSGWDRFLEKPAPPMDPEERYAINIGVGMVAYVINIGHSLRVTVTSSCYPYYSANPNTVRRARTASPLASRPSARAVSESAKKPRADAGSGPQGAALLIPPVARHQIWPTWPDHTENVTARNTCAPAPTRLAHGTPSRADLDWPAEFSTARAASSTCRSCTCSRSRSKGGRARVHT